MAEKTCGIDAMETHPNPENGGSPENMDGKSGNETRNEAPPGEKVVTNGKSREKCDTYRKDSVSTAIIELDEGYEKLLWEQYSRMPQLPDVSVSNCFKEMGCTRRH